MRLGSIVLTSLLLLAAAAPFTAGAQAQDTAPDRQSQSERPSRGMTMTAVESRYGAPTRRVVAVGTPPITRWEYPGFVVYFEYDHVVHSVADKE